MSPPTTRRAALKALAAAPALLSWQGSATTSDDTMAVAGLESRHGGRLGVAVLDVGSGVRIEHRADERFAMCSTFKVIAAALVLTRVDRGEERLDRRVVFTADQLVTYSPGTEKRVGPPGMTVAELCEAALTVSDNTAANLMLAGFGGPGAR